MIWGLHKGVTLYKKTISDVCLVYQQESGDTHIFKKEILAILDIIDDGLKYSEIKLLEKLYEASSAYECITEEQFRSLMLNLERYGILERYLP